mmetsp:Transcript_140346/g.349877  ORF Transcript_140346/g.349877 Transcript_140346/m.349877 type:complete len:139 (-) Transcript_140346:40-456(-)
MLHSLLKGEGWAEAGVPLTMQDSLMSYLCLEGLHYQIPLVHSPLRVMPFGIIMQPLGCRGLQHSCVKITVPCPGCRVIDFITSPSFQCCSHVLCCFLLRQLRDQALYRDPQLNWSAFQLALQRLVSLHMQLPRDWRSL